MILYSYGCYNQNINYPKDKKRMKKLTQSKITLFVALLIAVLSLSIFPAKKISAMEMSIPSKSGKTVCCMMVDKKNTEYGIYGEDLRKLPHGKNMTVLSFKSSNEKVIKAWTKKYDFDKKTYPVLKLRKSGTAKLTLTYKSGSKRYNYTVKVQVIKYQNPFKTFKIGNKNYASVYNKVNMYGATLRMPTLKNGTYKFALKPNKNFTINTAKLQQTYGNTARNVNIKNAKIVKITKDAYFMFMMKYKNMDIVNVCFQG